MRVGILALVVMLAAPAGAEQMQHMDHAGHEGDHQMHGAGMPHDDGAAPAQEAPRAAGQAAFAAIQEVVGLLLADPDTDWSRVDIDALRAHLVDMDNVTMRATVTREEIAGGARFRVTSGEPEVVASIRRMVLAHAGMVSPEAGWQAEAAPLEDGAVLSVAGDAAEAARIRALGFFGVMTVGMHHQAHHLALAQGANPHQH